MHGQDVFFFFIARAEPTEVASCPQLENHFKFFTPWHETMSFSSMVLGKTIAL